MAETTNIGWGDALLPMTLARMDTTRLEQRARWIDSTAGCPAFVAP